MSSPLQQASQASTQQSPVSFLFEVRELTVNDDTHRGGEAPRYNEDGRWTPPVRGNGFHQPSPGRIYRWRDGIISPFNDCFWWNGNWWASNQVLLAEYKTTTMFWCNYLAQFLTATGNAASRNLATSPAPHNRWWPLTFRHEGTLSRVEESGEQQYLAGTGTQWIGQLGLNSYHNPEDYSSVATGLAGNLAIIIALVAFSCRAVDLNNVLLHDRAWLRYEWRGHHRPHGRINQRGVIATIYLDPHGDEISAAKNLELLEWSWGAMLQ